MIAGTSPQDVLQKAWGECGVECSVEDFKDFLWRAGFVAAQVGTRWQLALPSDPTGGMDMEKHRRLHNLTHKGS